MNELDLLLSSAGLNIPIGPLSSEFQPLKVGGISKNLDIQELLSAWSAGNVQSVF